MLPIFPQYEGRLKSKFPYFFLRVLWTARLEIAKRYNFWVSGNTVKIVQRSLHKNIQNTIENVAAVAYSRTLCTACGYSFFPYQNKSAVEIHKEVCLVYDNCLSIQMIRRWREHTSLWISTADLFWVVKKWITMRISQCTTTRNGNSNFNTVLCMFLWSECYAVFNVARNSKIISPCNFKLFGSQNAEKKIEKLTFETILVVLWNSSVGMLWKNW